MAKVLQRVRKVWSNSAKGPYKWHHTVLMQNHEGDLFIWTYTASGAEGERCPSNAWFTISGDQQDDIINMKAGQMLVRLTKCKIADEETI